MQECRFSLTRILPHKHRIVDSVLIRENAGQLKPIFSHILCSAFWKSYQILGKIFLMETLFCIKRAQLLMFFWYILRYSSSIYFAEHLWKTTSRVTKQKNEVFQQAFLQKMWSNPHKVGVCSHLRKNLLMKNGIFFAVSGNWFYCFCNA